MTYIPDPKEKTLSRTEFEMFLENLRLQEVVGISNVEFKNLNDQQILLMLDVLFGNAEKRRK